MRYSTQKPMQKRFNSEKAVGGKYCLEKARTETHYIFPLTQTPGMPQQSCIV